MISAEIPDKLLKKFDEKRGMIQRSPIIRKLIALYVKGEIKVGD